MQALRTISTAEAVVQHFKEQIRSGSLAPGDRLPSERELTKAFGISRFSLREGLARLSALGLVKVVHGKGTFVSEGVDSDSLAGVLLPLRASGGKKQAAELLEARTLLEGELSALAATRHSPEQLAKLEANLRSAETNLGRREAFCRDDLGFHQIIAAMAQNSFLRQMHSALSDDILPEMAKKARTRMAREGTLRRHREMFAAIRSRDTGRVRRLSAKFLREGGNEVR